MDKQENVGWGNNYLLGGKQVYNAFMSTEYLNLKVNFATDDPRLFCTNKELTFHMRHFSVILVVYRLIVRTSNLYVGHSNRSFD